MYSKKTLELNPHHPVMKVLLQRVKQQDGSLDEASTEYADLLFEMALLNSGFDLRKPTELTTPLEKLIRVGFGIDRHAEVEEIEVDIEEDVDEDIEPEFDLEEDDEMISDEL
jgi:heat shock protein 90kDa beta